MKKNFFQKKNKTVFEKKNKEKNFIEIFNLKNKIKILYEQENFFLIKFLNLCFIIIQSIIIMLNHDFVLKIDKITFSYSDYIIIIIGCWLFIFLIEQIKNLRIKLVGKFLLNFITLIHFIIFLLFLIIILKDLESLSYNCITISKIWSIDELFFKSQDYFQNYWERSGLSQKGYENPYTLQVFYQIYDSLEQKQWKYLQIKLDRFFIITSKECFIELYKKETFLNHRENVRQNFFFFCVTATALFLFAYFVYHGINNKTDLDSYLNDKQIYHENFRRIGENFNTHDQYFRNFDIIMVKSLERIHTEQVQMVAEISNLEKAFETSLLIQHKLISLLIKSNVVVPTKEIIQMMRALQKLVV